MLYQVVDLVLYYVLLGIYLRGKGTPGMFDDESRSRTYLMGVLDRGTPGIHLRISR
jgi:hypothetical protein